MGDPRENEDGPQRKGDDVLDHKLAEKLDQLHELFNVDAAKLKIITQRFQEELDEGLQESASNIPMNVTWVRGFPTGHETGQFITLDLGGTNLRVCWITLKGREGETDVVQDSYKVPDEIKTGEAKDLWTLITDSLASFLEKHQINGSESEPVPLAFTFSYPATQDRLDHGVLQTWTKGLDIKGVEGEDAAGQLRDAIKEKKLPIKLVALVNDTTGAMIASAYKDPDTIIGAIFGTGCNAAYQEETGAIPKAKGLKEGGLMAINCEYGAFDNALKVLPRTKYDTIIDKESPRPGEQSFEKMSAGLYLGEIFRLVLIDLHSQGLIFAGKDLSALQEPYVLDTGFLAAVENDESSALSEAHNQFQDVLQLKLTPQELVFCQRLAIIIATRGARLCTCGVAAICRKRHIASGHVAADGSVANKHPKFKQRWAHALGEILDWPADREEDPIIITSAEDGSGIGAAVIAAMAMSEGSGHG